MDYKKPARWILVAVLMACALIFLHSPDEIGITRAAEAPEIYETAEMDEDFAPFQPTIKVPEAYSFTENDEYVLLQIAMAEAGDQDLEGKVLVMNVILNRIRDEEFPGTVEEVVMQPGQFEPVDNGSFYEVTPDGECVEALELVAAGWDGSFGATYFEEACVGSWQSVNLRKLFVHGCHTFYSNS